MEYTREELEKLVEYQHTSLNDEAKYRKFKQNDVTFEEYVLSSMKNAKRVDIDFDNYDFKILESPNLTWFLNELFQFHSQP